MSDMANEVKKLGRLPNTNGGWGFDPAQDAQEQLEIAIYESYTPAIAACLEAGAKITPELFSNALRYPELAAAFLKGGLKPTQALLKAAVDKGVPEIVGTLLDMGVKPTQVMLEHAVDRGQAAIAEVLIDEGLKPTRAMLDIALAHRHDEDLIKVLLGHVTPTNSMLAAAVVYLPDSIAKTMMDKGVKPTEFQFQFAMAQGRYELATYMLTSGRLKPSQALLKVASGCGNEAVDIARTIMESGVKPTLSMVYNKAAWEKEMIVALKEYLPTPKTTHPSSPQYYNPSWNDYGL